MPQKYQRGHVPHFIDEADCQNIMKDFMWGRSFQRLSNWFLFHGSSDDKLVTGVKGLDRKYRHAKNIKNCVRYGQQGAVKDQKQ